MVQTNTHPSTLYYKFYTYVPQELQKFSSLKSLKIQNHPPIPNIFQPATIRNGFHNKLQVAKPLRTPTSTNNGDFEIGPKQLNVTLTVRD